MPTNPRPRGRRAAHRLLVVALVLAACSSGGDADPEQLLVDAAAAVDALSSVHVEVTSPDLPDSGSVLVSASGDAARPDAFVGSIVVRIAGASADVEVLSTGGQVYAQLPFTSELTAVDPSTLGFSDPAALIAPDAGIGEVLRQAEEIAGAGSERLDGTVYELVDAVIPGSVVADLLTSAAPEQPVQARLWILGDGSEVGQVQLTGPFYDPATTTTYLVRLTDWDVPVQVPAPPEGS